MPTPQHVNDNDGTVNTALKEMFTLVVTTYVLNYKVN